MAVALTILHDPGDVASRRTLSVAPGTTILKAAHAGGVDITATCGGRGPGTSCRGQVLAGPPPPPPILGQGQPRGELAPPGGCPPLPRGLHPPPPPPVAPPPPASPV